MIIGAHLSASKGYTHMLDEALSIGANTFQFFTRNPRGGKAKDIDEKDVKTFLAKSKEVGFGQILPMRPIRSIAVPISLKRENSRWRHSRMT